MYDYYLGGAHNFGPDRALGRKVLELFPDGQLLAQANRAFLHRSVRYLLSQGIRQFLDIGSGIPTAGNVHEVAQKEITDARVVYVDNDPVAVAHSEALLRDNPNASIVHADLRHPDEILSAPVLREILDVTQPIGILLVAVLHFVPDEDNPAALVTQLRQAAPTGSYLAIAHGTADSRSTEANEMSALYRDAGTPLTYRTRDDIAAMFGSWPLVEPGLVWVPEWRPDWPDDVGADPSWASNYGGVAWKP